MSFFRKLFGGTPKENPPQVPVASLASGGASAAPEGDLSRADQLVDCSALSWRGEEQIKFLRQILAPGALLGISELLSSDQFRGNPWCSAADGLVLYAMAGHFQPGRIMEIGAGYTTHVFRQAKEDYMLPGELITIDPEPRDDIAEDVDAHLTTQIQDVSLDDFSILQAGEMVFIDSTHVDMPGSDAAHIIDYVLPALPTGVIVGLHGIRLPRDYAHEEIKQGFNEQERLLAFLAVRPSAKILLSGGWLWEERRKDFEAVLPAGISAERPTFLWFQV